MTVREQKLVAAFLKEAVSSGRREQGIMGLRHRIPKFFVYLEEKGLRLSDIDSRLALGYQGWLLETGRKDGGAYSARSVHAYLVAAGAFYDFLKRKGVVLTNPFKEISYLRTEKKLPREILKEKEINRLLAYFAAFDEESSLKRKIRRYKMHVLLELLYSSGLRITEAANLRVEDIDLEQKAVRVVEGKGGIMRKAFLNEYTSGTLKSYLNLRPQLLTAWHDQALLFGTGWQRFGKWANEALREASTALELPPVTCHGIRHALGFHLLRSGCPLRSIQVILGHKRLRNTEIYTQVEKEDLKRVIDTYHPRQWRKVG